MANALTPEAISHIKNELVQQLDWNAMSQNEQWQWSVLLTDEPLETKFYGIVLSLIPGNPEIDTLAAIGGRQPRTVINHTNRLAEIELVLRTSGRGRGITSRYEQQIPVKTQLELAARLGITIEPEGAIKIKKVHLISPFEERKVQQDSPLISEKVQPASPFGPKRCNQTTEKVQPDSPPFLLCNKNISEISQQEGAPRKNRVPRKSAPEGYERFIAEYPAAMRAQTGKGNAAARAQELNERAIKVAWGKLSQTQADQVLAYISEHARNKGSFMMNPENYITSGVWKNSVAPAQQQDAARELYLQILTAYRLKREWPQEARDHWGSPPDAAGSNVPPDLWQEAQERAKGMNGAGHHD
jgi:hypothetical protein